MKSSYACQTFLELVNIDCVSKEEEAVSKVIQQKLTELGISFQEDKAGKSIGGNAGNLYVYLPGTLPGSVFFSAHMDRVIGGKGIRPHVEQDRITSSGDTILAADDLSGVAGVLDGLRRIRESDLPHKGVEVLFTVAEEIGLLGSKHFDYSRIRSKEGYLFDGDGRLGTIVKSAPSQAVLEIEVFGKAAHAGCEPEKGINAIIGLSRILASIRDGRLDTESTANFSYIQGGKSSTNIVCDYAYCKGETRSKHHENMLDYIAYFHRHAKEAVGDLNVVVNTKDTLVCEAFDFDRDTAVVKNAIRVCGDMGIPCEVVDSGGCMDANIFNVHGMETVGMGTGMEEVHTFSEYQWLEDLHRIGEMIERITR